MARRRKEKGVRKPFTTSLPEELTKKIKHIAVEQAKTYSEIVEEALRDYVEKEKRKDLK
jgi:predicted transcriptional regulator